MYKYVQRQIFLVIMNVIGCIYQRVVGSGERVAKLHKEITKSACDFIAMDRSGERQVCIGNEMMLAKLSLS